MKKLSKRWQYVLYGAAGMGINMLNLMVGSYLCSALLVGGFGKSVIPYQTYAQRDLVLTLIWGGFAFAAKIIDGIIDIPMASLTDNLRSRFGRRRPAILGGLILTVAAYLLFLVIPARGATLGNTIYYGVVLCVFYSFYTLTMVTYYATYTEIVETEEKRRTISNVKSVCDILYFILGYVVVRMLLNGLNVRIVALIVLPLALTMIIPLFMIKEPSSKDLRKTETVGLFKSLACTFKNRTFIIWMVVYAFMTFGVQLFLGGINEYFSFVGMNMIFVMIAAFAPVPFTLLLYNKLVRSRGFGFAFRYTLLIFSAGMLCMFFVGLMGGGSAKMILSVVTGLLSSFAIGAIFSVAYSIPSQLAAEEEASTGVANSAMYFAVQGLFAGVASGIATGVVLTALKGSETQDSAAMKYLTLICALGTLAAFILTFALPKSLINLGNKSLEKGKKD